MDLFVELKQQQYDMRRNKNWEKFNEKPFRIVDEEIKKGDYFIFNDDGRIRKCTNVSFFDEDKVADDYDRINDSILRSACKKIVFDDSIQMEFEDEKLPEKKTTPPNLKKGDICYYLDLYNLDKGIVESIGPKNVKIKGGFYGDSVITKPFDSVAEPNEKIAVVWEQWKGVNGRGGYRLERNLYPNSLRSAKTWPYQSLVWEDRYGVESDYKDTRL